MTRRPWRAALLLLAALCGPTLAHDSWFAPLPTPRAGDVRLALGTGTRFPVQDGSVGEGAPVAQACRHGDAKPQPLRVERDTPTALIFRAHPVSKASARAGHGRISCWAQLVPLEVVIAPEIVPLYLREINASKALRETWAEMLARGVAWKEHYTKHARTERFDARLGQGDAPAPQSAAMGMDIVLDGLAQPPRIGEEIAFTLLRDGAPLAGLPVELRSSRVALGLWLQTDAQGRAAVRLPFAGEWLLRAVDLRLSPSVKDEWESRFVTLTFEVR